MICVYDDTGCRAVDTSGMTKIECRDCPHSKKKKEKEPEKFSFWQMLKQIWLGL